MSGENHGVVGELVKDVSEAVFYFFVAAAGEVGASNASLEECVTGESHVCFFAVEGDRAPWVAWCLYHAQLVVAEADDFVGREGASYGRNVVVEV